MQQHHELKSRWGKNLHFSNRESKFPTPEIMGAENLDLAITFPKIGF